MKSGISRAILLAAGRGTRLLGGEDADPKCLLEFGGESLLERHVTILARCGIPELVLGVGYRAARIEGALAASGMGIPAHTVRNREFERGSLLTLWTLRGALAAGGDVLLMDADVLYDYRMIQRLIEARNPDSLLLDRDFVPGDEPVVACVRDGRLVEFRKRAEVESDLRGESVGFFRLSESTATDLAEITERHVRDGLQDTPHEDVLRELMLEGRRPFGFEDVTGLPWIEIDFPEDVERAKRDILPRLVGG